MNSITFPLKPGDNNENVVNLKAALQFLIEKERISVTGTNLIEEIKNEDGYKGATKRVVAIFQQSKQITPANGNVNEATATALNKELAQLGAVSGNIDGFVYMDYGIPANNIKLRLYAKGFAGNDTVVKEISTNEQGQYAFSYDPANIASTNFEVRAVDAAGKEHTLSSTLYNTDNTASISSLNLIAPGKVQPVAESEFTRLSKDVASVIGDIAKLNEAQEKDERQDITFLSQSTNWDARPIALASLAGKLSEPTKLTLEAAYALVRSGLPTEADQLAQVNISDVDKALETAAKTGIVNLNDNQRKEAVAAFQTFANKTRLTTKDFSSLSTYDDLLTSQQLSEDQKNAFANAYFAPRKNATELWQKAEEAGVKPATIKKLQLQGKLGMLTGNNAPLAQNLQNMVGNADNLAKLVDEGLYEPEAWDAKLKALAGTDDDNAESLEKLIPPAYVGGTIAERKQAYATDMAAKVREAFPEKVIQNRIEKNNLVLGDNTTQIGVSNFLKKAKTLGYKVGGTHIDSFIAEKEAALFSGASVEQKTTAIEGVKLLSRIHQVTPNDEAMQVMLELGHTSAQDIVSVPKEDFLNRFAKKYSDKFKVTLDEGLRVGKLVYNKSQQVHTTTYSFFTATQTMQQTPPVFAITGNAEKLAADKEKLAEKIKGAPNLQQLFGSLDFCECEHCRSVLSPAAYLVDLLQFLDRKQTDWQYFLDKWKTDHAGEDYEAKYTKPYDALIDRRPDLINLPLTCENTNTALPYIDIVNEILEYYLVNKKLTEEVAHDTGNATTPELLAEPQNVEPKAYGILKEAKYPLNLPYDLWLETVRQFCGHYDIPLWQVLETLQPVTGTDFDAQNKIAIESLHISSAEYAIITNENPLPKLFELYGYASNAQMATGLKSAKQLSNRLGVTYKELLKLVQTQFINPQLSNAILLQKMAVSINDIFRFKKAADFASFSADEQQAFKDKLKQVEALYGFDAEAAMEAAWTAGVFKQILLLNDTNAGCNFDATLVGYADSDALKFDWLKFNLFVRLWRKLGWTMEETDEALNAFLPANLKTIFNNPDEPEDKRAKALAQAFKSALIYIAHLTKLAVQVNVGKGAYIKLSTLWINLPTISKNALYSQLFLSRNVLKIDSVFDHALGQYLSKDILIKEDDKDHSIAIQAALNISANDLEQILNDNELEIATAKLSLTNVSLLYRYALLAKAIKLSVTELIILKQLSGLNPFTPLSPDALAASKDDNFLNQTLQFVNWALRVKESGFKLEDVNYLFRHRFDPTGKYRNAQADATATIQMLANEINRIRAEHAIPANTADATDITPFAAFTDDVLQQKLSLVIPANSTQNFFAMWTGRQPADWDLIKDSFKDFLTKEEFDTLFVPDAADADGSTKQKSLLQKRATLAKALLPFIQKKVIHQAIVQVLATALATQTSRIEWIINDAVRLHDNLQPDVSLKEIFSGAADPSKAESNQRAFILLSKVIMLAEGFELSDKELQYIITHPKDFNDLDWSKIPVEGDNSPENSQALFKIFIRLADYVRLRQELAGGSDDLIDIFAKARLSYDEGADVPTVQTKHLTALYQQVSNLTRRDVSVVAAIGGALDIQATTKNADGKIFVSAEAFADERGITALWRALKLVQTFGVPVETLTDAAQITLAGNAEEKYQSIAEDFKNAVKARYELEAWQQIAQPIFDKLRQQRRDALVAYLLHNFRDVFNSLEEMYEYFLVDPGTEPVVQTSRIRIATASIQLFIQRCLLNLESRWDKKVPPAAINAKHWQWMNRYRVWEANRKIFLWPENWLEPEWRDDKTHLFKELEGKLLQGDVSNDLVEDAFYVYLQKLEELARLDIVATYCEEDTLTPEANKLHVIGRTYGFPHKYFYRRYAQQMWTPWEPVDTEIDGNHIVTVMWRGRLHLFWVTFLEKMPTSQTPSPGNDSTKNLADWSVGNAIRTVTSGAKNKIIEAHLHWSEYYNGKWSTKKSGGLDRSIAWEVPIRYAADYTAIIASKEAGINDQLDGAVLIYLTGPAYAFRLVNKNYPPEIVLDPVISLPRWPFVGSYPSGNRLANIYGSLSVRYQHIIKTLNGDAQETQSNPQTILGKTLGDFNIVRCAVPVTMGGAEFGPLVTPFFYQDSWYTFYIEPALTETITINEWDEWVGGPPVVYEPPKIDWDRTKIEPYFPWPKNIPVPKDIGDPRWIDPDDSRIKVRPVLRQDWTTNPDTYVKFDERVIGKDAGMNVLLTKPGGKSTILVKEGNQLNNVIHNASDSQSLVLVPADKTSTTNSLIEDGNLKDAITVKTGAVLVGGAGITSSRPISLTQHTGGIFSKNLSSIKSIKGF